MSYTNLLSEINDNICTITINRPDAMNALNKDTIDEIRTALEVALTDRNVRAVVFRGEGDKAFVAGADISEFAGYDEAQGLEMSMRGHAVFNMIENSFKPVVALINGFALGGGCELAMACHLRIATENARFGQPEVKLGIVPGYGGTQRLIRLIGRTKALEYLMSGSMFSAKEAERLGLVNYVVEKQDDLMPKAKDLLAKITANAPLAIARVLSLANAYENSERDGMTEEIREFGKSFLTEDFKEGTDAFLNKRKPEFKGQ